METQPSFDDIVPQDCSERHPPSTSARIIGASCGAFVFCFVAILISLPFNKGVEEQEVATYFWIGSLSCGALGGFAFPRVGHFLAYAFILFINIMLSFTIGRNIGEQAALFGTFAFSEVLFFLSREVLKKNDSMTSE